MAKNKPTKKLKVAIGISGGVDSTAAAYLLTKQGYDCFGIFMHYWTEEAGLNLAKRENECCSLEGYEDARRVCKILNIPLYTLNFRELFKKEVVDAWLDDYQQGLTPNPCLNCNKLVRFGAFLEKIKTFGADYLATGHYVKKTTGLNGQPHLWTAKDKNKDQSYFLSSLTQEQLSRCLFPLGDLTKPQVRKIAQRAGLPTAQKTESHEICFIKENTHNEFLKRHTTLKPGDIVLADGQVVGQHYGLQLYTLGQRKGVGLGSGPFYVIGFNHDKNQLIVSRQSNDPSLFSQSLIAKNVNIIAPRRPEQLTCYARIRYRHPVQKCLMQKINTTDYQVTFVQPQRAVTRGQGVVFYRRPLWSKRLEVLGGGIIE